MLLRTVFLGPNLQNIVRQIYDIWKVYDKCTIKRDLQKILRQSYHKSCDKVTTNVRQLISCCTTVSSTHAV